MAFGRLKPGLATKFSFIISLPVLITSLALSSSFIRNNRRQIETAVIERGDSMARGISRSSEYGLLIENKQVLDELVNKYADEKDLLYISIQNESGEVLASQCGSCHDEAIEDISPDAMINDLDESSQESDLKCLVAQTDIRYDFSRDVVTVRASGSREDIGIPGTDVKPGEPSQNTEKIGTVRIGLSKASMIHAIRKSMIDVAWLTIGAIAGAVLFTVLLVRIIVRPIKKLAVAAREISEGNFDHVVEAESGDEIGHLAESFRKMVGDLKISSEALQYRLEIEETIAAISTKFINLAPQEVDTGIDYALQTIGRAIHTDLSYVFLLSGDLHKVKQTYEWYDEGIETLDYDDIMREISTNALFWWDENLRQSGSIHVSDVNNLPPDSGSLKDLIRSQGIRSFAIVPMLYGGELVGILGCSSVRAKRTWIEEDVTLLRMVGEIFANAFEHRRTQEAIHRQLEVEERLSRELNERAEELSRINEELNTFVYTVSHDLKSPLVSLQGFSAMLMKDHLNELDEDSKMYIERIQKNVENMGTFITDLLELSRVGRMKGRAEETDVSDLISNVASELAPQLEERGTKLIVEESMPQIRCDRTRVNQIFTNLISNANKFMGENNENPTIHIGHEAQNGFHTFYVSDNGIGIDEKYHEKIFQIFQRLQDIETEGTGAGLAIVKKIVENLGGRIWVDSAKGKGTKMYFTMPETASTSNEEAVVLDAVDRHTIGGG